jgi:HEAT repeat protein
MCGCANFWDDVTSREFSFNTFFVKPNPLVVLRDSSDGDQRARALRALHEPNQTGGTKEEQEAILKILTTAASTEKQPLCRLAAIQSLGRFKDTRAIEGLANAFYAAGTFMPDTATVIRCEALSALGATRDPGAVELLARVAQEPPAEGPEIEKQQALDVRLAAIRSLAHYSHYQATEALVHVLRAEKDVALRDCAHQSLEVATGKKLPPDAKAWEDALHQDSEKGIAGEQKGSKFKLTGWWF